MKLPATLVALAALTGCASISDIAGEPVAVFPAAPEAPKAWAKAGISEELPEGNWIAQFNDPVMEALVTETLTANPDLRAQLAVVRAARAQARSVYGRSLPNVSVSGSAGVTSTYSEITDERFTDPTFGARAEASWTADLWGRIQASIDAAEADLAASEADLASARLSLAAQTAIAWTDLNEALAQERVAVQTYEARDRIVTLTERRFARGLSTALDVRTARSARATAEAAIAARRQASGNATRRLEILLGRYPANEIEAPADLPELAPIRAAGTPTMLLSRRPDIAASEARLVAAGLRAEQARLALLPSLTLTGSLAANETELADLIDPVRIAANAIAGLSQPVFNGGALKADRDAAIAQAERALALYAGDVLTAWREVEDTLAADEFLADQVDAQRRALDEAIEAEELATRQYSSGLVSIFNLIDAQTRRLNAESNLIAARSARVSNRISFHLAIGGAVEEGPAGSQPDI
ncbi:MAG: RND transporter [Henriciella sp.]|jgi:NodT family efflux transporter outer membrane factor (OMF) lipoprotein|uniref:efflux transporter outer membrane subunit n=3 Tax=Henriciella TaxID=453849 RepID=UPI000C540D3D|nr:RND transporter [Henriciella sp.]MBF33620.1 RND transporter [Hyphomonadaceae bacterium]|tara:strand:- start:37527 stop:38942 length:1416 start_codon:yes stop_codon:yes gene_type:complete